jgi:hypothetical protein
MPLAKSRTGYNKHDSVRYISYTHNGTDTILSQSTVSCVGSSSLSKRYVSALSYGQIACGVVVNGDYIAYSKYVSRDSNTSASGTRDRNMIASVVDV